MPHSPSAYNTATAPPVKESGQVILCILHMLVSGAWIIGTGVFQENVAWFMAGVIGYFHMVTAVLCMAQFTRRAVVHEGESSRPWYMSTIVAYLVASVVSLPGIAWYMGTLIAAKHITPDTHSTLVRQLAHAMWHEAPGAPVAVLVLLSLTALLLVADVIIASMLYHHAKQPSVSAAREMHSASHDADDSDSDAWGIQ